MTADFAIVGAGIAGSSLAAELAEGGASVLVLEAEDEPGYHATGRSAAFWEECYGGPEIVPLTPPAAEPAANAPLADPEPLWSSKDPPTASSPTPPPI